MGSVSTVKTDYLGGFQYKDNVLEFFHVDHKKAEAKRGSGTPDNGQVLCRGVI